MTSRADPQAGFTLIEMIVVLLVLSLGLGLIVARGPARSPRVELDAATAETVQTLRAARIAAIAADRPVRTVFDPARRSVGTERGGISLLPASVAMTGPGGAVFTIGFAPDGSSSGGAVELTSGALRRRITVDWLTGRVGVTASP